MIHVFENQYNETFWYERSDDCSVTIYADSTLHWIKKYKCRVKRMPGHNWLDENLKNYENITLISAIDNREQILDYYDVNIGNYIYFPFLDMSAIENYSFGEELENIKMLENSLILLCLSSPKQDLLAYRLQSDINEFGCDIACVGYAVTDEFMSVPKWLLKISSLFFLEWVAHLLVNPKRFKMKISGYFK